MESVEDADIIIFSSCGGKGCIEGKDEQGHYPGEYVQGKLQQAIAAL